MYSNAGVQNQPSLDLCIPVYNEADIILRTISTLSETLSHANISEWKLIVANNGSTDRTAEIVERAQIPNVVLLQVHGKGKGRAIRESAAVSRGDMFGFIDADLSASPEHILEFLLHLHQGSDLVIGTRLHAQSNTNRSYLRTLSSRHFNMIARAMTGVYVTDTQCGLKIMGKKACALLSLTTQDTWFLDIELLLLAMQHKLTIVECPITWEEHVYTSRKSKLRIMSDGLEALRVMYQLRRKYK